MEPAGGIKALNAGEAGIYDVAHAGNGQRGFGDVGGDDDLAPGGIGAHDLVLLLGGQVAVERQERDPRAGVAAAGLHGTADLVGAGHENEHVAGRALRQ